MFTGRQAGRQADKMTFMLQDSRDLSAQLVRLLLACPTRVPHVTFIDPAIPEVDR